MRNISDVTVFLNFPELSDLLGKYIVDSIKHQKNILPNGNLSTDAFEDYYGCSKIDLEQAVSELRVKDPYFSDLRIAD